MGKEAERKRLSEPMAECPACRARFAISESGAEDGEDECPKCGEKALIYDLGDDERPDRVKTPGEG